MCGAVDAEESLRACHVAGRRMIGLMQPTASPSCVGLPFPYVQDVPECLRVWVRPTPSPPRSLQRTRSESAPSVCRCCLTRACLFVLQKFDLDLPQVMKVEAHDDAVLDSRGCRGGMRKVPSLSDLSDPESSMGKSF